jgi:chromosomal replication initiator protein
MPKKEEIWNRILKNLENKFSKAKLDPWCSQTRLRQLEPGLAVIEVPNKFFASWIRDHYSSELGKVFEKVIQSIPEIRFTWSDPLEDPCVDRPALPKVPEPNSLDPGQTFNSFVVGKSNRFACASSLEVARRPGGTYNPLYIFGEVSLGKTHLLNAIGHEILQRNPLMRTKYLPADQFTREFSMATRKQRLYDFREAFRHMDVLLMDDLHLLGGKERIQAELISILNLLLGTNRQVIITAKGPPKEIQHLDEQLRSRLQWGLLAEIALPDQRLKIQIIEQKAQKEGISIPDDVIFYLASTTHDIGSIMKSVVRLFTHASLSRQKIDISTVKSVMRSSSSSEVSIDKIQKLTAGYFNVSISDLLSNKKIRKVSYPRQLAMFLCRDFTPLSFKEIGEAFGKKDHSSVIYAVKKIEKDKENSLDILNDLNKLRNLLA